MPCKIGLRTLAHAEKEGVKAAGGIPIEMNTVAEFSHNLKPTDAAALSKTMREAIDLIEPAAHAAAQLGQAVYVRGKLDPNPVFERFLRAFGYG